MQKRPQKPGGLFETLRWKFWGPAALLAFHLMLPLSLRAKEGLDRSLARGWNRQEAPGVKFLSSAPLARVETDVSAADTLQEDPFQLACPAPAGASTQGKEPQIRPSRAAKEGKPKPKAAPQTLPKGGRRASQSSKIR